MRDVGLNFTFKDELAKFLLTCQDVKQFISSIGNFDVKTEGNNI